MREAVGWFAAQAGSFAMVILQFLLMVIISAILYVTGEVQPGESAGSPGALPDGTVRRPLSSRRRPSGVWRLALS